MKAASLEEIPEVRERFTSWYSALSIEEQEQMRPFCKNIKKSARAGIEEIKSLLIELKSLREDE